VAILSSILEEDDVLVKFLWKYTDRINDTMKAVKAPSELRDRVSKIYKQIKKRERFEDIPADVPARLVADFHDIQTMDVEKFDEVEVWTPDCLSFRFYNLMQNYRATRGVSGCNLLRS
jgi:hypothetical protein